MKQHYLQDIFAFANTLAGKVVAILVATVLVLSLSSIALAVDGAIQAAVNTADTSAASDGEADEGEGSEDASADEAAEGTDEVAVSDEGGEEADEEEVVQTTEEAIQSAITQQAAPAAAPAGAVDEVSVQFSATNCTFVLNGQNISDGVQNLPLGKDLTFTVTPDSGYKVDSVEIQTGGPIPSSVDANDEGVYTIDASLVTSNLSVSATATKDETTDPVVDPQPTTVCDDTVVVAPGTYAAPVITLGDITRTYMGAPQLNYSSDLDISVSGLQDEDELVVSDFTVVATDTSKESNVDAGTHTIQLTKYWIKRTSSYDDNTPEECRNNFKEDVTEEYQAVDLTGATATLTIEKADLYIVTPSATKYYDGTPLTYEGDDFFSYELDELFGTSRFYEYAGASQLYELYNKDTGLNYGLSVTGTQTKVGSSPNTATITPGNAETALAKNYNIHTSFGRLTVLPPDAEIALIAPTESKMYDGRPLSVSANDIIVDGLPEGFSATAQLMGATRTDAGRSAVTINESSVKILNQAGEDVTSLYDFTTVPGELYIEPAGISVVTFSASKAADGRALTAGGDWAGLVNGETATFATTGSQTSVGSSQNTYSITWNGSAKQSNYRITSEDLGTLTVTVATQADTTDADAAAEDEEENDGINDAVAAVATGLQNAEQILRGEEPTDLRAPATEESLGDDETPLGVFDEPIDCWVHWYSILGLVATAVYGGVVMFFRRAYAYELESREANVLGAPVGMAQPQVPAGTSGHAGREA